MFDEAFYLQDNADVAEAVKQGRVKSGRNHYCEVGFKQGRGCFALDPLWYCAEYPLAALEVGQGDYADFSHHYVEVGAMRGHKPLRNHNDVNSARKEPAVAQVLGAPAAV
jgi:alkaline phosphatase D